MSNFLQPQTLAEALSMARQHPDYTVIAGGTDLLVASKDSPAPVGMIDLMAVEALSGISATQDGIAIGATTTYASVLSSPLITENYSLLHAACKEVGASQIQARGTLGGNIATSSPVGDSLPALLALDAQIQVESEDNARSIPYRDFLTGYRKVDLAADELIVAITLPLPDPEALQYWRKVGTRRAQSISKVMIAAVGKVENNLITGARIALGAVADRTVLLDRVCDAIEGKPANESTAVLAKETVRATITPIDDLRSSAEYRLSTAENIVARFVLNLGTANGNKHPS